VASPASNASRPVEGSAASASSGAIASSNRPAVDVTAVTTRDDFLLELGDALGGQASVRPVESVSAALEHLNNTKRGQVLVFDSRDIAAIREDVDMVHARAPHVVMLVFATSEAEKQIGAALKGSTVFAVLPIPIDKRKTAAVLEGVITDAIAKKGAARASAAVTIEPFRPQVEMAPALTPDGGSGSKNKVVILGAAALAAVVIAGGTVWLFSGSKSKPATGAAAQKHASVEIEQAPNANDAALAPKPAADMQLVKGSLDELLEKARGAMRERHYTEPSGDNALVYYRSAAAVDPTNGEALDGLQRVASVLASRFDDAMGAQHFDEAALSLANLKAASPRDARIPALELRLTTAQVNKALADGNVERAAALVRQAQQSSVPADQLNKWRTEIARRQEDAKLQRLAGLVSDRIRDGKLTDPAEDSAKAYMQQLREAAPTNATTQRAQRDLNAAYMRKAREAALGKNQADEDHWLVEAKSGGVTAADITAFQRELATARQKAVAAEAERFAQVARERIRDGRLTDPAQDSAAYYVGQLQGIDPSNSALAGLTRDLAGKLIDRARSAARDPSKAAQVESDLAQAKRWGADPRDIQGVQQLQSTARATSTPASRASATAPGPNVQALAAQLKRTHYVPPDYPQSALDNKLAGVVTLDFTVGAKGETSDIRVTDSSPPGVFDKAAIAAVKHWRYEPVKVNGAGVEIPVRTTIRFELPK
jgi:periplasmic protein TonB